MESKNGHGIRGHMIQKIYKICEYYYGFHWQNVKDMTLFVLELLQKQ